jgi:hypothetical protein
VIGQGAALQQHLGSEGLVAVGGTAVALHCGHRYSLDVDCVTPRLRQNYDGVLAQLDSWEGWRTNRRNPPVLILGEREGVELGIRQLRHRDALDTERVRGLCIPTAPEALRIKAYLLAERRATRDYLDVAALLDLLGLEAATQALTKLPKMYPPFGRQTAATAFAEACEAEPLDLRQVDLSGYRGLRAPFRDWEYVAGAVRRLGRALITWELNASPPGPTP